MRNQYKFNFLEQASNRKDMGRYRILAAPPYHFIVWDHSVSFHSKPIRTNTGSWQIPVVNYCAYQEQSGLGYLGSSLTSDDVI